MPWAVKLTSPRPFGRGRRIGAIVTTSAITVLVVGLFAFTASISQTGFAQSSPSALRPDIAHLLRMTAIQAGLSTLLSLTVGIAVAWSLNRLRFWGRDAIASLFAAAIVAPGLVVAFGLIAVWGRSGLAADLVRFFGGDWSFSLFGLHGILLAHLILDGAFAARILLTRLDALPAQKLKIAQSLNLGPFARFRVLDWPEIVATLPGLGAIIFLLAFTSFPIVLLLGGGPGNQTMEVAIYAAVRLQFDIPLALNLALLQLLFCAIVIGPALIFSPGLGTTGVTSRHHWSDRGKARTLQIGILLFAVVGFALPLVSVIIRGIGPDIFGLFQNPAFWRATLTSLGLGTFSALLTLGLALSLLLGRSAFKSRLMRTLLNAPAFAYLVVPAIVLSLAFFVFVRSLGIAPARAGPLIVVLGNALLALPFAVATLAPSLDVIDTTYAKLVQSLNMSSWQRWSLVEWPLMRHQVGIVLALGFCFSLGDLGIISLFGTDGFSTLPWLMYRALGAYRSNDAAAIAALLLIISFAAFWMIPKFLEGRGHAQN